MLCRGGAAGRRQIAAELPAEDDVEAALELELQLGDDGEGDADELLAASDAEMEVDDEAD
jgi:hypothetical protein